MTDNVIRVQYNDNLCEINISVELLCSSIDIADQKKQIKTSHHWHL